jgi:hypothetical protein
VVSTLGQSVVIRLLGRVLFIDRPKNSVGLNGFAEGERRVADRSGCEMMMTPLRYRVIDDMTLAGLAPRSQDLYIRLVRWLAAYYRRSPEEFERR